MIIGVGWRCPNYVIARCQLDTFFYSAHHVIPRDKVYGLLEANSFSGYV